MSDTADSVVFCSSVNLLAKNYYFSCNLHWRYRKLLGNYVQTTQNFAVVLAPVGYGLRHVVTSKVTRQRGALEGRLSRAAGSFRCLPCIHSCW